VTWWQGPLAVRLAKTAVRRGIEVRDSPLIYERTV
jgi:hypothetical protein